MRGRFYVHAGMELWESGAEWLENELGLAVPDGLRFGAIIGTVELYDCVRDSDSPWALPGRWHWLLRDPRALKRPIPVRGRQGWWSYERGA